MPIISVERFNSVTKTIESALINSEQIVWVEELHLPNVPAAMGAFACDVWLTSGKLISIHSSIEELQEAIYFASLDSKPPRLERNPWGQNNRLT